MVNPLRQHDVYRQQYDVCGDIEHSCHLDTRILQSAFGNNGKSLRNKLFIMLSSIHHRIYLVLQQILAFGSSQGSLSRLALRHADQRYDDYERQVLANAPWSDFSGERNSILY